MKRKYILWIALPLFGLLALAVVLVPLAIHRFFYPVAPPMPPVVTKPMTELLAGLESLMKAKAPQVLEQMQPGLAAEEIVALERQSGVQLTDEIRALYRWHNGVGTQAPLLWGPIPGHRFVPLAEALGQSAAMSNQVAQAFPAQRAAFGIFAGHRQSWIALFDDGAGDGYFFDPKRKPKEGAIFYCFAEDSTYTFFPSLKNLLTATVKCFETDAFTWKTDQSGSHLDEDFAKTERIWKEFGATR